MTQQTVVTLNSIFQLKITIKNCKPPIWRRIQVRDDTSLSKLHRILQIIFWWTDTHLHSFTIDRREYGVPSKEDFHPVINERNFILRHVIHQEKQRFLYTYDFGDGWEHEILVEKMLPAEVGVHYPRCIAGKRKRPPEDCGGPWGYMDLMEIRKNPDHPDYAERMGWLGDVYDPEGFDIDLINGSLKRLR